MTQSPTDDATAHLGPTRHPGCILGALGLLVSVAVLLLTAIPSAWMLSNLAIARDTANWTPTPATITRAEGRRTSSVAGSGGIPDETLALEYTYTAAGAERTGTRYAWLGHTDTPAAIVAQHPRGASVTCSVDPGDPERAVLVTGVTEGGLFGWVFVGIAALALIGIVGCAILILRSPRWVEGEDSETAPASVLFDGS